MSGVMKPVRICSGPAEARANAPNEPLPLLLHLPHPRSLKAKGHQIRQRLSDHNILSPIESETTHPLIEAPAPFAITTTTFLPTSTAETQTNTAVESSQNHTSKLSSEALPPAFVLADAAPSFLDSTYCAIVKQSSAMYLINVDTLRLETFVSDSIPPYAILSHTWGANQEEISFEDIQRGNVEKPGNGTKKLKGCCNQAKRDHLEYAWIDTCCIDKKSSNELEEAINSMFQWYREASVCYAYLSDVPSGDGHLDQDSKFFRSRWFQRGWTLQELLAPKKLQFYDQEWDLIGTNASMARTIEAITGISRQFLLGWVGFHQASVAQRMSWAANRKTSRREDIAYCLLGLFDVTMPMIYGEGDRALGRLMQEIMKRTGDHSILAWGFDTTGHTPCKSADAISGILATAPSDFANCGRIVPRKSDATSVDCGPEHRMDQVVGIPIQKTGSDAAPDEYFRPQGRYSVLFPRPATSNVSSKPIYIHMERQSGVHKAVSQRLWLHIDGYREVNLNLEEFHPTIYWENERGVVSEVDESNAYTTRRYLARFRTHDQGTRDVIIVLELEINGLQSQARYHVMTLSRDTPLEDLSQKFMYMRPEALGKQAASIGTLRVKVTLEEDWVAQEPMWVVKLALASSALELDVPVDANLELDQVNMKIEYVQILQDDDEVQLEAKQWSRKKDEEDADIHQMRDRLAEIKEHLRRLGEEKNTLSDELEKRVQQVDQFMKSLKEAEQQQAERMERKLQLRRRLDGTNRGHGNWLEAHISALLSTSDMDVGPNEVGDSDSDRPQFPEGEKRFNTDGQTPLSWAATRGHVGISKLLIEEGADIETTDHFGRTPLSLAAIQGHEAVVRLLIEKGAEIETKGSDGLTLVLWAASAGHEAVVRLLIEKGADIETKGSDGHTALSLAASAGHEAVVRLLVEKGADIETKGNGLTSVLQAASAGHEAVVRLLIEKGAEIETKGSDGLTPVSWAASAGHEAVVRLLIEKGADIETTDGFGRTPFSLAASAGHEAVVRLLVEKGAEIETKGIHGRTALSLAASNAPEAVVRLFIKRHGRTALSLAASNGHEAVVRLLVEKGADIETTDDFDHTPLSLAASAGHEAVVRLLIEKGADIETTDDFGRTPLSLAAFKGHEAVVRLLVEKGAEIETKGRDGLTPVLRAASNGHEAVVRLLIEKGADIETTDGFGRTPFSLAASNGHEAVTRLLRSGRG